MQSVTVSRRNGLSGLAPLLAQHTRLAVPAVALAAMVGFSVILQPRVMSYFGLTLLLRYSEPLLFATMAQLCILTVGDVDLSIGPFISLVNCIVSVSATSSPTRCALELIGCVIGYVIMGAFIQVRALPSIVVTLGFSFIWLGFALLTLPTPGGSAPDWLVSMMAFQPPLIPMPILLAVMVAVVGDILLLRTGYGAILRGIGSNATAIQQAGWSLLIGRTVLYGAAGLCGVLSGLTLSGLNTTGDPWVGAQYTLLSIAGAIIGGAEFSGGIVSPIGAVFGAGIMLLSGSLLSFLDISTDWQLSVQGGLLTLVLALRTFSAWGVR
ncbi:ABC transporter permease [Methylocapsa sp. S129]|uniref:ABC transporter permease n=1 Tax=Methylocapsa sp. S129 TaxID=1641869 RepID=UPI00131B5391|nr:ABC transporter permease [Methylocapsa sp. S129]